MTSLYPLSTVRAAYISLNPGFPRNPSLAPPPLFSTVCSAGPRAPARQMVVRFIRACVLRAARDPGNQPNLMHWIAEHWWKTNFTQHLLLF